MPAKKKTQTEDISKASALNTSETPDRFKLGEMGSLGVRIFDGISTEELKRELQFPYAVRTYKEMTYHPAIAAPLTLYGILLNDVKFKVVEPEKASEEEKEQAKFVKECLNDLDGQDFNDFVQDAISAQIFGFSIVEKVYRRRLKANGSKFNDGKIGIKKLAHRSQDTITKFLFDDSGNEVTGVKQDLSLVSNSWGRFDNRGTEVILPRKKFMHIRVGRHRGDPYGKSPLSQVYFSYKYLTKVEELEGTALAKDLVGIPVLKIPAAYLASDADAGKKQIADYFRSMIRNIQQGAQSGIMIPSDASEETRLPLFEFELAAANGKKLVDTSQLKEYYTNQIMTTLLADILIMGQSTTGSYALGSLKNNLVGAMCKYLLDTILREVNRDLIKQLYELNGWDTSRMCRLDADNVEDMDLEAFSKAVQRYASTSSLEIDRPVLNKIRESLGVDAISEDEEPREEYMPNFASKASEGQKTPFEGTRTSNGSGDDNAQNLDNTA